MTNQDIATLNTLRELGVKAASFGEHGVTFVEFFPLAAVPAPIDNSPDYPKNMAADGPTQCKCGHDETEHAGNGLCLIGCDYMRCQEKQPNV